MRKEAVKKVLFSLATVTAFSAHVGELPKGLHLIEELPIEQRAAAHEAARNYFIQNPEAAADAKLLGVDEKGTVYALDEKMHIAAEVGKPSCYGGCDSGD